MISAVICTHNRASLLAGAIRSLLDQQLPTEEWELIVVDNASTDDTALVARSMVQEVENARYVREPRLGVAHARNTGVCAARGEIVAFIDDDAEATSGWLAALLGGFDVLPAPALVAGRILPVWTKAPPGWLPPHLLRGYLSVPDFGREPRLLDLDTERPITCNLAFRRQWLLEAGGFDIRLGRRGASLMGNEDTEMVRRIFSAGGTAWYVPGAVVRHLVPAERLTRRWLVRRMFAQGRSDVLASAIQARSEYKPASATHASRLAAGLLNLSRALIRNDQQALMGELARAAHYLGVRYQALIRG